MLPTIDSGMLSECPAYSNPFHLDKFSSFCIFVPVKISIKRCISVPKEQIVHTPMKCYLMLHFTQETVCKKPVLYTAMKGLVDCTVTC